MEVQSGLPIKPAEAPSARDAETVIVPLSGEPVTDEEIEGLFKDVIPESYNEFAKRVIGDALKEIARGEVAVSLSTIKEMPDLVDLIESRVSNLEFFVSVLSLWKVQDLYRPSSEDHWLIRFPGGMRMIRLEHALKQIRDNVLVPLARQRRKDLKEREANLAQIQ